MDTDSLLSSRLYPRPDFINEALPGLFLFLLPLSIPCPQAQEAQHVHFVDFLHAPAVLHQFIVLWCVHGCGCAGFFVFGGLQVSGKRRHYVVELS